MEGWIASSSFTEARVVSLVDEDDDDDASCPPEDLSDKRNLDRWLLSLAVKENQCTPSHRASRKRTSKNIYRPLSETLIDGFIPVIPAEEAEV